MILLSRDGVGAATGWLNGLGDDGIVNGVDAAGMGVSNTDGCWMDGGRDDDDDNGGMGGVLGMNDGDRWNGMGGARIGVTTAAATMGDDDHTLDSTTISSGDASGAGMRTSANRWNMAHIPLIRTPPSSTT